MNQKQEIKEGQTRTLEQIYRRHYCGVCGELATHQLTFLLPNARCNPASSAYRHDDCSWCSDEKQFVCDKHEKDRYQLAKELGMEWCASFPYEKFKHLFGYWEDIK